MKVGFIGLGRMGEAMARRILDGGHELLVYNRTPDKVRALADRGAGIASSIGEAAGFGDAVFTMLADDAALEDVAWQQGLLQSLPRGGIHVCAGTHGVGIIGKLEAAHAEAGQIMIASPMLGRPEVVTSGQAGVVVAGPQEAVAHCRPLFEAISRRVFEAGAEPAAATAIKIANNFVLGCAIEAMGEGFSLVRKYGVPPQVFYDVMTDGLFASPAYKVYGKIIVEEAYANVGQMATLGLKDANLALVAGEAVGVPLPSGNVWRDRLVGAVAHGDGGCDWAVMAREQARASGLS
ncbi:MAG: NAD(P)-dependent oxidoreductase [Bradyrhizobiaceae bacterium]|nr:NAD(P)-dependent oxidoreductase [Bradyrhizobiaceae bacterium]